jgi:hypothetical protein
MTDTQEAASVDYQQVLSRIRAAVRDSVPGDATVLVVSRGDEELLKLDERTAWHFPREPDGRYAGYHPRDSADALSHLDEWRARGAGFLVLPATGYWWLDYYGDFGQDLRRRHSIAFEDDACIVFRLGDEGLTAAGLRAAERVSRQVVEFVDCLLPADAVVAVVSSGDERLVRLSGRRAAHFPPPPAAGNGWDVHRDPEAAVAALEEMRREEGIEYLVVPDVAPSWLDLNPGFPAAAGARYRCIAYRASLCSVFDLNKSRGTPRGS